MKFNWTYLFAFLCFLCVSSFSVLEGREKSSPIFWKPKKMAKEGSLLYLKVQGDQALALVGGKSRQVSHLYLLDISRKEKPKVLGQTQMPGKSGINLIKAAWNEKYLYLAEGESYEAQLHVFDISQPDKIRHMTKKRLARGHHFYIEIPEMVWLEKKYLYIELQKIASLKPSSGNLFVFDISSAKTAKNPKLLVQANAHLLAAKESQIYAGFAHSANIQVIDIAKSQAFPRRYELGQGFEIEHTVLAKTLAYGQRKAIVRVLVFRRGKKKNRKVVYYKLLDFSNFPQPKVKTLWQDNSILGVDLNSKYILRANKKKIRIYKRGKSPLKVRELEHNLPPHQVDEGCKLAGDYLYLFMKKGGIQIIGPLSE